MKTEMIKVLLIDDDEDDYILTRELLADANTGAYALDWARSYQEGLQVAERGAHHVCLVDYQLGERNGVELIREAREARLNTPMILFTGSGNHDVDVEALQAGATDYLIKTETSPARLERTIRYAVQLNGERCRAEKELAAYAQKQAAVARISRLALSGGELNDLFAEAVALVEGTLTVEYSDILELLPDGKALVLRAGCGWNESCRLATVSAGKESQAGFTLLADEPVVIEDWRRETRFSDPGPLYEQEVVSSMSVIIRGRERSYGVLGAHAAAARKFATDDVSFLNAVANVLAEAIGRKGAEDELRQSEARFRALFDLGPVAVYSCDVSGRIVDFNRRAAELWGREPQLRDNSELFCGSSVLHLPNGTIVPKDKCPMAQVLNGRIPQAVNVEILIERPDGTLVTAIVNVVALRNDRGEITGAINCFYDISDRKIAEKSLRQSESQFRALFENALDAVLIANDQGIYLDANPAACELLGVSYFDVLGHTIDDFTEQNEAGGALHTWDQFLEKGTMRSVCRLRRADGTVVEADLAATANFLPGRHLSMLHDVTQHRKLEEQLRQSQKLESVGLLAGGIAHDFNNLLTVITGYSELSLRRLDKSDPLARNAEEIKKAAQRATSLTRQLLAFSRKQVLQPRILDLNLVIADIEKMLGRLVGEDMQLRTSPCASLGQVKADPGQIEQVLFNLVVNARDAMPGGGKITIETANTYLDEEYARQHVGVQPGRYAMLAVTDTGIGMDAEIQKSIFEPFFTTKEQGKGTGLGLSTVYGIIKQSGGNIWVYSEVGVGTSFKIYLPRVDEHVTISDTEATRPEFVRGTETILLAEDEALVRRLTSESLKMNGYTVLEAANAEEAMLICEQHEGQIHLLLTDVVMPSMSGRQLAERLVSLRPDTRILYMSGYTDRAIVHHGILDEDIAFISKPFTPDALLQKVGELLAEKLSGNRLSAGTDYRPAPKAPASLPMTLAGFAGGTRVGDSS